MLAALRTIIDDMLCELSYQLTPLPDLVRHSAKASQNELRRILFGFADNLDRQIMPDALSCMEAAIQDSQLHFRSVTEILSLLGHSLGRFDLSGQMKELEEVREICARKMVKMETMQDTHLRIYRILGICAGIALTVFLI